MADIPEGSFTHPLEDIDAAVTQVENTQGEAASLTAAVTAIADTEITDKSAAAVSSAGTKIPSGTTSLDGYMEPGLYYSSSAITPASDAFRLEVKEIKGSSEPIQSYPLQFVYPLNSSGYYYERAYYGGEWKAWKRIEPFGCVGSNIPDNSDLFTLPVGRYYKTSHVSSTYVSHLPSDLASSAILVEVLNTVGTNRRMIRLYQATQGDFATWYQALETGSGYGSWYKYTGTAVAAAT